MSVSRLEGGAIGWGATNKVGMDNCSINSWWSIVMSPKGGSDVTFAQNVSDNGRAPLVHNWQKGTTLTGGCESPSVNKVENSTPAENTPQGDSDSGISEGNNETNTEEAGSTGGTEAEETEETLTTEQTESLKTATSNIGTLKDAYTACTGKTCTKAEKQEKYNAWKEAVDNCNATYRKSNCSANGVKIDDYSDDDIDESHLPEAEQTCTGKNGKSCPCGKMNNGGNRN